MNEEELTPEMQARLDQLVHEHKTRSGFPYIENIRDVLPAIEGYDEFIVAYKENYTVINYVVSKADTFGSGELTKEDLIRRECRGITFCSLTGDILRRPFHKFFNIGEREETLPHNIDISEPHVILDKLDGSMCSVFRHPVTQELVFGTKMCAEDFHQKIKNFVSHSDVRYVEFCQDMISSSYTPIFEYYENSKRIVLDYGEEFLILTAIRHMNTGRYLSY
jgi:RNA ligase